MTDKSKVGPIASCGVTSGNFVFDWDSGHFLLRPEVGLVPKTDKERVWDEAHEFMVWLATKPVKRETYEVRTARRILDRVGFDYMKYQRFLHRT